jgi:hypothetical protein
MENLRVMQKLWEDMKDFTFKFAAANVLTALIGFIILLLWIKAIHDVCPLGMP